MDNVIISIVVTCYNKRETIAECIKSILDQKHDGYELIIVDDGSDDGSDQDIQQFKSTSKVKIINTRHKGVSSAKNFGATNSNGKIILFVDGDCVVENNALSELLETFEDPTISCVGGEVRAKNSGSILSRVIDSMQNDVERKWPFGANVAYTREALNKSGRFEESMKNGEDAELFLKVVKLGYKYNFNPKIKVRTVNPDTILKFFRQRLRWGTGFAQLIERHPEVLTKRIKLCFALSLALLLSPFLAIINIWLITIFAGILAGRTLMIFPLTLKLSKRAKDKRYYLLIPFLGLMNAFAYLFGTVYWKILELTKHHIKLEVFSSS